ncbi:MAG: hypothetical protein HeimC2_10410 [Candidatus Heimdallarchaeota archaeon LC_2]|nr:MAG: hypothetical protein HeimC2_10410 [Candidatus Heimdallarchaeota archaeon LC_2]
MASTVDEKSIDESNLLLIGDSATSVELMNYLHELISATCIVHVSNFKDAVILLLQWQFSVVILDHNPPNIDAVSFSRVVRLNHSSTRIIVISPFYNEELFQLFINQGSVDEIITVPIDKDRIISSIKLQQARTQINHLMNQMIRTPPIRSPAYFLLQDQNLEIDNPFIVFDFVGLIVSYKTNVRFQIFLEEMFETNKMLFAIYLSAITIMGQNMFSSNEKIKEINFGAISVIFHFGDDLQISILFKNITKYNISKAEKFANSVVEELIDKIYPIISTNKSISKKEDLFVKNTLETLVDTHRKSKKQFSDLINVVFYGKSSDLLIEILTNQKGRKEFFFVQFHEDLLSLISDHNIDLVIINPLLQSNLSPLSLSTQIKDISPRVQIVGMLDQLDSEVLKKIISSGVIDIILTLENTREQIHKWIKNTVEVASIIKNNSLIPSPLNLRFSYQQTAIARSLMRLHPVSYLEMNVPTLLGIFIIRNNHPFYSKLWFDGGEQVDLSDEVLVKFITSLNIFSREILQSNEIVDTIKYGNASLIIHDLLEFSFIMFAKNIDDTNFELTYKHMNISILMLYDLLNGANIPEAWNEEFYFSVDQIIFDLFFKFSSLSSTE